MYKLTIDGPFTQLVITKQVAFSIVLAFLLVAQSLGVIYTKQNKRLLHARLQDLYAKRDKLQIEWSQLLLEQGTWEADARVERVAREQLGMVNPDKIGVIGP